MNIYKMPTLAKILDKLTKELAIAKGSTPSNKKIWVANFNETPLMRKFQWEGRGWRKAAILNGVWFVIEVHKGRGCEDDLFVFLPYCENTPLYDPTPDTPLINDKKLLGEIGHTYNGEHTYYSQDNQLSKATEYVEVIGCWW